MEATPPVMEPAGQTTVATTSLFARMFNIFATPTEVFDEVKVSKPSTGNWLVPVILGFLVGTICVVVLYSQPAFLQKIHEQQTKALDKQVQAGKMTQAQADQAEAMAQKFSGPSLMIAMGVVGVAIMVFAKVFWWALILWLFGKWFLKASFPYQQSLEVAGLTLMIGVLAGIVVTLLTACIGDLTPLNLSLIDREGDPTSLKHLLLGTVDVFDLWSAGILALGLARLAGVAWGKALGPIIIYWVAMDALGVLLTWLPSHLAAGIK